MRGNIVVGRTVVQNCEEAAPVKAGEISWRADCRSFIPHDLPVKAKIPEPLYNSITWPRSSLFLFRGYYGFHHGRITPNPQPATQPRFSRVSRPPPTQPIYCPSIAHTMKHQANALSNIGPQSKIKAMDDNPWLPSQPYTLIAASSSPNASPCDCSNAPIINSFSYAFAFFAVFGLATLGCSRALLTLYRLL